MQADAVDVLAGDGVDLAVGALARVEDGRVELGCVGQRLELLVEVGDLLVLDQGLRIGERDLEDLRQRASGELGGERGRLPFVFLRLDVDAGVGVLELLDLGVEGVDGGLLRAGQQRDDTQRDGACRLAAG